MKIIAFAVVLVCCTSFVKSTCPPTWTAFPLTHVKGLVQQNPNIKSEASCKSKCEAAPTCLSIDWNFVSNLCFFGTAKAPPAKIADAGVNHHDLSRDCPVTTTTPKPPPPPTTTPKPPPPPPPPTTTVPPPPTTTVFTIPPLPLTVCKVDVVFCIDNSGSINMNNPNNFGLQLQFMQDLVARFKTGPLDAKFGAVGFGNTGWIEWDFNKYSTEAGVVAALGAIPYKAQGTIMSPGLYLSRDMLLSPTQGARPGVLRVVIFITDGVPNAPDVASAPVALRAVKDANIVLIAVGIGSGVDKTFMSNAASTPNHFVFAESFNSLSQVLDLIIREKQCKTII